MKFLAPGGLAGSVLELLGELRELRNRVAYAPEFAISTDDAAQYAEMAVNLAHFLEHQQAPGG